MLHEFIIPLVTLAEITVTDLHWPCKDFFQSNQLVSVIMCGCCCFVWRSSSSENCLCLFSVLPNNHAQHCMSAATAHFMQLTCFKWRQFFPVFSILLNISHGKVLHIFVKTSHCETFLSYAWIHYFWIKSKQWIKTTNNKCRCHSSLSDRVIWSSPLEDWICFNYVFLLLSLSICHPKKMASLGRMLRN